MIHARSFLPGICYQASVHQATLRQALLVLALLLASFTMAPRVASAQSLQAKLIAEGTASLAEAAVRDGDAARGAVVFHQPTLACARCHSVSGLLPEEQLEAIRDGVPGVGAVPLGPNLTELPADSTDVHLVESILAPSAKIRQGFESITVETSDGEIFAGLPVDETAELLRLRHPLSGAIREFPTETIEARSRSPQSAMPEGQADQLTSRQQFLDLVRYLIEIRDGGAERARQLQPPASMFVLQLPEYEAQVDHAGLIRALDDEAFRRGEAIYQRLCINCHGDRQQPGSLPTAPRFATSELRNGADPYSMYRTLTHGFGFMVPQTWMVPRQKYDVIHYIRMAYFADRSEPYAMSITDEYLASLPAGNTFGPEPIESRPWVDMDYGPSLINTYEIPTLSDADVSPHLAYKGIAVRLDPGPGGVSRGSAWALYDHDLMSLAAAWTYDPETPNERFIDWYGIHFDGRHGAHPSLDGDVQLTSGGMPGWAAPDGSWRDESRVVGRDGRRYGPLPQDWAKYRGIYHSGDRTILSYSIGETAVLESPSLLSSEVASASQAFSSETLDQDGSTTFLRTLHIGPRSEPLQLLVAVHPDRMPILTLDGNTALVARATEAAEAITAEPGTFDGNTWIEVTPKRRQLDMSRDFTLVASLRTEEGGTIFCRTAPESDWVPDGKTFFVRDGRLNYDIGWVGCVTSDRRVDDGQWHEVALSWEAESQQVRFMIDGKPAGEGNLKPQGLDREEVIRLGMTAQNFPQSGSGWNGDLKGIAFYQTALSDEQLAGLAKARRAARQNNQTRVLTDDASIDASLEAAWLLEDWNTAEPIAELREQLPGEVVRRFGRQNSAAEPLMATVIGAPQQAGWSLIGADARGLALQLPAGEEPLSLVIAVRRGQADEITASAIASLTPIDLTTRLTGQGSRWPEVLTTTSVLGDENGPFAVDVLAHPERNPWLAQMRFSGLDFLEDGDSMVVTSWDGDVWKVSGLREGIDPQTRTLKLTWRRIVSGLFQPLGVKVVDGTIYVSCRDQLAILRDADRDGEAEFVECFNSDHQVTEHFHEFAMGLQRDAEGNWYYAKSARHALTAVVPHHGTLLRVSPDGSRTDIVATGFRAANGVCLNPDGTFIVTDQEGHWNPKNRINWVREGGFYGNMFGYHDQTDASDAAMEQPLCWITNAFDRSPAELLWVDSPAWGPLQGSLLNLSYGYGKVFVVPHENLNGQMQGAMCELPIPQFPTGVMRGRFRAEDGHLYLCGLFAWAGNQTQPGGLYRMRATGKPATVPIEVHALPGKLTLVSSDPLDRERAGNPLAYSMLAWSLRRSADYGSPHLNERKWQVTAAKVSEDGRTVELTIPDLQPTWCYELRCLWVDAQGTPAERVLHGTVHGLGE